MHILSNNRQDFIRHRKIFPLVDKRKRGVTEINKAFIPHQLLE